MVIWFVGWKLIYNQIITTILHHRNNSIYYTEEGDHYEVVTTLGANAHHDYLSRFTAQLSDGEDYYITLGGYGSNRTQATLTISRSGTQVSADVHTDSDMPNSPQLSLND